MIPQMRNFGAVRSEFKSHLLHGTFLANFDGFTAGKPLFIDRWSGKTRRQAWLDSSFNHLTLLGADYGAWSMSYGYYFPSFAVAQGEEFRELTAAKASPAFYIWLKPGRPLPLQHQLPGRYRHQGRGRLRPWISDAQGRVASFLQQTFDPSIGTVDVHVRPPQWPVVPD
jgi:hypothetical protein